MDDSIKKTWTADHGNLVFEITIVRAAERETPSSARIFCRDHPGKFYTLPIYYSQQSEFHYRFNSGCYVFGYLSQKAHVQVDGIGHIGIYGDFRYGYAGRFDEQRFEGFMVTCPTEHDIPPEPIVPDNPINPLPDLSVISAGHNELFPYVYVRKWPTINQQDLQRCFIGYIQQSDSSPPVSNLYSELCSQVPAGRAVLEQTALYFIEGVSPYENQFIGSITQLNEVLTPLIKVSELVDTMEGNISQLIEQIQLLFHVNTPVELQHILISPAYSAELDRIWQNYFSLVITLGFDTGLLMQLIKLLTTAHMLNYVFVILPEPDISNTLLHDLLAASIILPEPVFPLPAMLASPPNSSPPPSDLGWIEPYAIGDLQMVRQRLLRYAPGEIAHIENIMRGEIKEISRKLTHRQIDYQKNETAQSDELENEASDERNNLQEETRKAIAEKAVQNKYQNYKTTYGPPTEATLDGVWSKFTQQGKNPGVEDVTRFARDILNQTITRITRKVNTIRSSSTMNESEDASKSTIDNSHGERNLVCVYRWLNKVYEAYVVNYGNRLMIEFMLRDPAAHFIQEQQELRDSNFHKPLTLQSQGILSFESVSPDNYAQLAATYQVTDIEPPPAAQITISTALRSGEEKLLAIPAGYCASNAVVTCIETSSTSTAPTVIVGHEIFKPGEATTTPRSFGEDTCMPISAIGSSNNFSPPSSDLDAQITVVIACIPSATLMNQWRIKIYQSLLTAYQKQLVVYQQITGMSSNRQPARSPLAYQNIERTQLKRGCVSLLLDRLVELTGEQNVVLNNFPTDVFCFNEPRFIQFFDECFEWDEMTYQYYSGLSKDGKILPQNELELDAGAPFSAFLNADLARLILPVRPARSMELLYFLSSGMIWEGDNRQTPVSVSDIEIINDIKSAGMQMVPSGHQIGVAWEILVPTTMQIIDLDPRYIASTLKPLP